MTGVPRYELKYWIDGPAWIAFIEELRGLVRADPNGGGPDQPWYTVTSLYFDTSDLAYFVDKMEGEGRRRKVRLRRYGRSPSGFAELKGKKGRQILKHRVPLDAPALDAVARGSLEPLLEAHRRGSEAAGRLLTELKLRQLRPAVITRYERAAFALVDDPGVRITVDRSLACLGADLVDVFLRDDVDTAPMLCFGDLPQILEVKFSGNVPPTIASTLRRAGLVRESISKYCLAVTRSRRHAPNLGGPLREGEAIHA